MINYKKILSIAAWIIGILCALLCAIVISLDLFISKLVKNRVDEALVKMPYQTVSYEDIHVRLLERQADVTHIVFRADSSRIPIMDSLNMTIQRVDIKGIHILRTLQEQRLEIDGITIIAPHIYACIREPQSSNPTEQINVTSQTDIESYHALLRFIAELDVTNVQIVQGGMQLISSYSHLAISMDSIDMGVYNLRYNLVDSTFSYNDSLYSIDLRHIRFMLPDSLTAIEIDHFHTHDAQGIRLNGIHLWNTIRPLQLAELRNREPGYWTNMHIQELHTTPVNIIREIIDKEIYLDTISICADTVQVLKDNRFESKLPYLMPQEQLQKLAIPLHISHVNLQANRLYFRIATTHINQGELALNDVQVGIDNIRNTKGEVVKAQLQAILGKAKIKGSIALTMDEACKVIIKIETQNALLSSINHLIRPLVGMSVTSNIDSLRAHYYGDKEHLRGEFMMAYHDLHVTVHSEDNIPYKILKKNAKAINGMINAFIPKSNPSAFSITQIPLSYQIEGDNRPDLPTELYLSYPLIDGVIKTMLPGLFVHKRTKNGVFITPINKKSTKK